MGKELKVPMGREPNTDPRNHGCTWSALDKDALKGMLEDGRQLDDMCDTLGRTRISILSKLVGMELVRELEGRYFVIDPPPAQLKGYGETNWTSKPASYTRQPPEETTMPIIEIKTFIAGKEAAGMTDMQIFTQIGKLEDGIEVLRRIKTRPVKLQKLIDEMQADVQSLVDYVDSRESDKTDLSAMCAKAAQS